MIPMIVHQSFTYGTFVLSLLTNFIFIWISTTTNSDSIGRYRYLMIGFALTDILVSLTHLVMMPLTSEGYIFFGYHMVNKPQIVGLWAVRLFVIFFYQTFIVLALHYIYRYAVVCKPSWREMFTHNSTLYWGFISFCAQILYGYGWFQVVEIGFLPSDYKKEFYRPILFNNTGIDISKFCFGYGAIKFRRPSSNSNSREVWQSDAIISIVLALSLIWLTAIVILACSFAILRHLRVSKFDLVSQEIRKTQHSLLIALIAQTAIPTIFSYIPLGMIFLFPLMGFNLCGIYGDLMAMSTAIFPALDPVIMLYFVRSYRARIAYIWRRITNANVTQVQPFSSAAHESFG